MTASAVVFLAAPRLILGVFTPDAQVVGIGLTLIFVAALFQIFDGLQVAATGTLRGLGDTRTPMRMNLDRPLDVRALPIGYTLCFVAGWGVIGLWIGVLIGLTVIGAVLLAIWRRRERGAGTTTYVRGIQDSDIECRSSIQDAGIGVGRL